MRFLADENISRRIIDRRRADGHDVESIAQLHPSISDDVVLKLAGMSDQIVKTEDHDFGELIMRQKFTVRGLILLQLDRLSSSAEAERVANVVNQHGDRFDGYFVVIEPARLRFRQIKGRM